MDIDFLDEQLFTTDSIMQFSRLQSAVSSYEDALNDQLQKIHIARVKARHTLNMPIPQHWGFTRRDGSLGNITSVRYAAVKGGQVLLTGDLYMGGGEWETQENVDPIPLEWLSMAHTDMITMLNNVTLAMKQP